MFQDEFVVELSECAEPLKILETRYGCAVSTDVLDLISVKRIDNPRDHLVSFK